MYTKQSLTKAQLWKPNKNTS